MVARKPIILPPSAEVLALAEGLRNELRKRCGADIDRQHEMLKKLTIYPADGAHCYMDSNELEKYQPNWLTRATLLVSQQPLPDHGPDPFIVRDEHGRLVDLLGTGEPFDA